MIKEALDELVAAYRDLRRMLARELGAEQAADLAQASVERVLAHGRAAAIRSPRAFLFQTARNLQVDHHRRTSCVRWEPLEAEALEHRAPEAVTVEATPERQVVNQDLLERVAAAIDALPPRCREAFVLNRIHGLPHDEVARALGISRSMVEKHVMRGLHACRALLEDERP